MGQSAMVQFVLQPSLGDWKAQSPRTAEMMGPWSGKPSTPSEAGLPFPSDRSSTDLPPWFFMSENTRLGENASLGEKNKYLSQEELS